MSMTSLPAAVKTLISPSSVGAPPPVAKNLPSRGVGDGATPVGEPADALLAASPFSKSHSVSSWKLPVASVLPSGLKRHRLDERDVRGLRRLAVGRLQVRVDERLRERPVLLVRVALLGVGRVGLRLEDVDLVAAAGGDVLPSGATATARTGLTSAGGRLTTIFSFIRIVVGAFAPSSIHELDEATVPATSSGSSVFGGMIGFTCRLHARNRKLSADLPGTTNLAPRLLPPFMTFS